MRLSVVRQSYPDVVYGAVASAAPSNFNSFPTGEVVISQHSSASPTSYECVWFTGIVNYRLLCNGFRPGIPESRFRF